MVESPVSVLHVWDHRSMTGQKDLHWGLLHAHVRSFQCIRELEGADASSVPNTVAMRAASGRHPIWSRVESRAWPLWWRPFERLVEQEARSIRPDVINAHFGTTGWKISALAERLNVPLVVCFYGADVSQVIADREWRSRYAELFRRASLLVVLCDAAADRLAALGCPREKLRIWNHPLDLDPYRFRTHSAHSTTRLLIGARFVEKKGYPFLLRACANLIEAGRDIILTAVGYGAGQRDVRRTADGLGLGERFRLIDSSEAADFDALYSRLLDEHDIFVLPSTTARSGDDEGGPALSLVLAQAAGVPVICTPFPGSERSVIDGRTGLFCRQDDADSLAEKIAHLIDHPEVGVDLAVRARDLVTHAFALPTQVAAMAAMYGDVATTRASMAGGTR